MDFGIVVTVENPRKSGASFRKVVEAGYSRGVVVITWHPLDANAVREVAVAARKEGFTTLAAGCDVNLLRSNDLGITANDEVDLINLCESMAMLDNCERLIIRSGSYGRRWSEPNLLNQGEDAYYAMVFEMRRLLGKLSGIPLTFVLQTNYAHILHDVNSTLRLSEDFPDGRVVVALEPAAMIAPRMFARHPEVVRQIVDALVPASDMVLVSDLSLHDERIEYMLPGRGMLNFPEIAAAIHREIKDGTPVVLRPPLSASVADLIAAREFLTSAVSASAAS